MQKALLSSIRGEKEAHQPNLSEESLLKNKKCLHQLFEETVDRFPQNIAVICENESITYNQLEEYANQMARYLKEKGVVRGSRVAILLKRSIEQYVAILAINKAGGCYVPLDLAFPEERIHYILRDCNIQFIITSSPTWEKIKLPQVQAVQLDLEKRFIQQQSALRLQYEETKVTPTDLSYIIYTSGTTGKPKGVMIEHHSVSHLVRASQKIYHVNSTDRIYQGFTIAFDASIEEIWLAFASGGTLVTGTERWQQAGNELPKMLTDAGITVLSCVPTLLSMWDEDIPTLRLLIVGGEDCPKRIVERWVKPGRRMINTYGPTETTVIATYAECDPQLPVTIGKPLPNYQLYIMDEEQNEVDDGESGELYIGGPGLARGYVNQEELTKSKFVFYQPAKQVLYRTGDLVRRNENGELEFLGRIDNQVKLRGYRVELSEIEEVLLKHDSIRQAVVHVHENASGIKMLVAYLVTKSTNDLDKTELIQYLKKQLPPYMIPSHIERLSSLPKLVSGKINRKQLPPPSTSSAIDEREYEPPVTEMQQTIAMVWAEIFHRDQISIDSDFFQDLGGHSLFAALVTSKLRKYPFASHLSISHLYEYRTVRKLAAFLEKMEKRSLSVEENQDEGSSSNLLHPISGWKYRLTSAAQALSIYLQYLIITLPFLFAYFYLTTKNDWGFKDLLWVGTLLVIVFYLLAGILSILAKWILIGRYRPGIYPLWGSYYLRWWIVKQIQSLLPLNLITGTPLLNMYYRLLGAKIGKNVYLGTAEIHSYDLLKIGDQTSIGADAQLLGYTVRNGYLIIGTIDVGSNCYIGANSILSPNVIMKDHSQLAEQSMISENRVIERNERWIGSPARKSSKVDEQLQHLTSMQSGDKTLSNKAMYVGFAACIFVIHFILFISFLPVVGLAFWLYPFWGHWQLLLSPFYSMIFIVTLFFQIAILKFLLLRKVKEGVYELSSAFYLKKWLFDRLYLITLMLCNSLYATLYAPPLLRILGAKIGKRVEISTVTNISPDLLNIDEESFIADAVSIGTSKIYAQRILIEKTKIGRRTFIGNSAHINGGEQIGNHSLLGVMSIPPVQNRIKDHTSWLGSPAIFLPKRDVNTRFSETKTYLPTRMRIFARYMIEYFRVTLPGAFSFSMLWGWLYLFNLAIASFAPIVVIFLSPILSLSIAIFATLLVVGLKWLLIGRYKPLEKPLWSTFVWRSELVTALYENVAVPTLVRILLGTPYVRNVLKWFGVKMGKRVYLGTTHLSEFDLVNIEDAAAINENSTIQTHLFEDRVMKMSNLTIGKHCSIGNASVILYDAKMLPHSTLGNLSLIMKGETLPSHTHWEGIPAQTG